jgi:alkanesulfonate monooxygenase SsuD/methylene tetrahydromethanopterin reductase-like flavin-dependent oxidoreductase (luciferase family)
MRVAVFLPDRYSWPAMLGAAREAEAAGVDRVLLPDHLAYGSFGTRQLEAWTSMAALAASTIRVGLGFSVLSATFRPPGLLAKMADTLDQIASGRLALGLGAGFDPEEHARFGLPFPSPAQRIALLEECCATVRRLCDRPFPLVIGSSGDRAMEVVARYADEWNCGGNYLDRAAERLARLASLTSRPILRSVNVAVMLGPPSNPERARRHNVHLGLHGTVEQMVARCAELRQLGFDGIWLTGPGDRATFERSLELLPHLRKL